MIVRLLLHIVTLLILWLPVSVLAAPVSSSIAPGLNLIGVTAALVAGQRTSFPLLIIWKPSGVTAIESYDTVSGTMLRAELNSDGIPVGADFPLLENSALYVYSSQQNTLLLGSSPTCAALNLTSGFNLVGHACFPPNYLASEFFNSVGLANITSLSHLDVPSGRWQTAAVDGGTIVGDDFPLVAGEGYVIQSAAVSGWTSPQPVISSIAPAAISTFATPGTIAISGEHFKADTVVTINGVDVATSYVSATLLNAAVPLQTAPTTLTVRVKNPDSFHAGGFFISDPASLSVILPPLALSPTTLSVQQGQPGALLTVTIPGVAPVGGTLVDIASSDPLLVSVPAQVTVPQGNTSVSVPLTVNDTGSTALQTVSVTASRIGLTSSQSTLSVRPKPTINLSPLSTLTGLTFTYLLTVNLSDTAPPGGFPVTLTAAPAGIVNVSATVSVPAGTSSAQVAVTATAVGSATVTATSPGRGFSGAQNAVTVKPIQTMNYGPLVTSEVGVQVGPVSSTPAPLSVTYGPTVSREVGVAVGSVFTGIAPNHGAVGTSALPVAITGSGLNAVTTIAFVPNTGLTVGTPVIASDGTSVTVPVDIAANAPVSDRTVVLTTAAGTIKPSRAGADIFTVTNLPPQILSVIPTSGITGSTITLQINGRQLFNASAVSFNPPDGIAVGNPPSVSSDGSLATVAIAIDPAAPTTLRTVTLTTPAGTTNATADVTNSFQVKLPATAGIFYPQYTPLVSGEVGVLVQTAPGSGTQNVSYGPAVSQTVGVAVGSIITSVTPVSGAIGSSGLKVRALGNSLSSATDLSFYPPDGITIRAESFAIGSDGNPEVTVDIAANAPLTARTVFVKLPSGGYALPSEAGSDQFRVTLPQPEIYSVQPIRAKVAQAVTMTIFGKNLAAATSVDFTPATGISVSNPPSVNSDAMLTVNFSIAANAPLGNRVVTVTTPGGVTSAVPTVANTFAVTSDLGTTYMPLISSEIGVLVSPTPASTQASMTYGPVISTEVGVMVTPAALSTSQSITYSPVVSTQVGVTVGRLFTGFSPAVMSPGNTTVFTLTGIGLDTVTDITVIPAANLTVSSWTPASDGRSGTVSITADAGAASVVRTLVPMVGSTALAPSAPGIDLLLIGYKPVLNSITTSFPASSVLANVGSTVTLTLNGVHLQGVTKVQLVPADGITVDSMPAWFSDGTGEHVSVKIVVDAAASPSDRLVLLTTPYGSTGSTPDTTNTLSIFKPLVGMAPAESGSSNIVLNETPSLFNGDCLTAARIIRLYGLSARKFDGDSSSVGRQVSVPTAVSLVQTYSEKTVINRKEQQDASRGPPRQIVC